MQIGAETVFDLGDPVILEVEGRFVRAVIKAVMVRYQGEMNVFYEVDAGDTPLKYQYVIEDYLVQTLTKYRNAMESEPCEPN
ncbi:MAG: hypothetical protein ACM3QZ_12460 [Solirubrobacterales bacterium]